MKYITRWIVGLLIVIAVMLIAIGAAERADGSPSGVLHHHSCEGWWDTDHSRQFEKIDSEGTRWYHSMTRTMTSPDVYKVVRSVSRLDPGGSIKHDHTHTRTDCAWNNKALP